MTSISWKETIAPTISLFLSAGTLVCCALPALFVSIGMGAVLAGMVSSFPQMIWLSENKLIVFGAAALMLMVAGVMQYRARNLPCPADIKQAQACKKLRRVSVWIYIFSVLVFLIGAFFAFIAPKLFF